MKSDDIVGYTYAADLYCPLHIVDQLPTGPGEPFDGWALAPGVQMSTEDNLDEIAAAFGIDREREETFDSGEFPKVVLADMAGEDDLCGHCGEHLIDPGDADDIRERVFERVRDEYHERIMAFLMRCGEAVREAGMFAEDPTTMHDDQYRWTFSTWDDEAAFEARDYDKGVDFTLVIAEAAEYEDRSNRYGMNFGLDIVENGGRILGGMTPFNYTDEVWVDARDADAVAARWAFFEDADVSTIHELLEDR